MKKIFSYIFFIYISAFIISFIITYSYAEVISAKAIMEKVDERDDGDNMIFNMEMILIDKRNKSRHRMMKIFSKDFGKDIYTLMFFIKPADVKDTSFLTYDYHGDKDDDQWLYLPALHKTKRIASNDKSTSFMGSDFSYADLTSPEIENYNYRLLKQQEVNGFKTWLIESIPKTKKIVDEYGYKKSILFVRQDNYVIIRAVHWMNEGSKIKYLDIKKIEKIDGIWTPLEITMTTKKGKIFDHKTILKYHDMKYNQNVDKDILTVRRMEKGIW